MFDLKWYRTFFIKHVMENKLTFVQIVFKYTLKQIKILYTKIMYLKSFFHADEDRQYLFIDSVTSQTNYNITIESLSSGTLYFVQIQALYEAGRSEFGRSSNTVTSEKYFHKL